MHQRSLFLVSDRTGITVDSVVQTLMTQFERPEVRMVPLPFIDTQAKLDRVILKIEKASRKDPLPPVVFSSLVEPRYRLRLRESNAVVIDFFEVLLGPLEQALGLHSHREVGLRHGIVDLRAYDERVEAVNFALNFDDGMRIENISDADVLLLGVSRTGKTPTSLYLALQYGIRAANYPVTPDDLEKNALPEAVLARRDNLCGLTISPERLQRIREERRPGSRYASLASCRQELEQTRSLYSRYRIPYLDTTAVSIEEIAVAVLHKMGLQRKQF